MSDKAFPFTAAEMRSQLPLAAAISDEGFDAGGIVFEGRINLTKSGRNPGTIVVSMPERAVLVPVDEWKEMVAWVARHEQYAAAQQPSRGDDSARARGGAG